MTRPFVLDMETSDPDDYLTLVLLLGHPQVDLQAVTVTPGTRDQIGLVQSTLDLFRRPDIRVGAFNINHPKDCVSKWHSTSKVIPPWKPAEDDVPEGWTILRDTLSPLTTLVTGAPLKNLGQLLARVPGSPGDLGRAFIQGGFAGEGVVPRDQQLDKFKGKTTCPSFNLNGDPKAVELVLQHRDRFQDLRFVSKNVCHGVVHDPTLHARFAEQRPTWCRGHHLCDCECHRPNSQIMHFDACCRPCTVCSQNVSNGTAQPKNRTALSQAVFFRAMTHYLERHPAGKTLHDPLAACCAINPTIGEWAEVELYRVHGEWGSFLVDGSGVQIITDYHHDRFVDTLLENPSHPNTPGP